MDGFVPRPDETSATSAAPTSPLVSPALAEPDTQMGQELASDQPIYQLDMVTGEFVPVTAEAVRVAEPTAGFDSEPARPLRKYSGAPAGYAPLQHIGTSETGFVGHPRTTSITSTLAAFARRHTSAQQ